jgi:hypothetical protein
MLKEIRTAHLDLQKRRSCFQSPHSKYSCLAESKLHCHRFKYQMFDSYERISHKLASDERLWFQIRKILFILFLNAYFKRHRNIRKFKAKFGLNYSDLYPK